MRTADLIKSKFIRGKDLEGKPPMTLTIADVSEELVGRGGRQETKCILWFHEDHRGLSINKARVLTLEAAYGPETDLWSGKRVRLYFDHTIEFGGRAVGGVGLCTPPGVVYQANGAHAGWGDAPQRPAGAPPPPVWDEKRQVWVTSAPPAPAPLSEPRRPPPPVWNEATGTWDTVNPTTGEITPDLGPVRPGPPPTISQRVNAGHPPQGGDWGPSPPGEAEFNDDIPF